MHYLFMIITSFTRMFGLIYCTFKIPFTEKDMKEKYKENVTWAIYRNWCDILYWFVTYVGVNLNRAELVVASEGYQRNSAKLHSTWTDWPDAHIPAERKFARPASAYNLLEQESISLTYNYITDVMPNRKHLILFSWGVQFQSSRI